MKNLNIICATDYSTFSFSAAIYAMRFAAATNSSLRLFHAYDLRMGAIPVDTAEFSKARMKFKMAELQRLEQFQDSVIQALVDERLPRLLEPLVSEGNPGPALRELVNEKHASLVMAAAHSYGSRRAMLGTKAWEITRNSEVPVLLIPAGRAFAEIKQIVIAAEAEDAEVPVLNYFIKIAESLKSAITILHVSDPGDPKDEIVFEKFRDKVFSWYSYSRLNVQRVDSFGIEEGLNHYCVSSNTDWLFMLHHERGILQKIFVPHRSHTKRMSADSKVPLLVIPESFPRKKENLDQWQFENIIT